MQEADEQSEGKKKKKTQKRACGSAGGELERSRERGRGGESARSVYSLDF